ncbi:MAG: hypothetical protein MHM6MM_002704 [Cercozoa sp. M6MM]
MKRISALRGSEAAAVPLAPKNAKKAATFQSKHSHLFKAEAKNVSALGKTRTVRRDMSRLVRWPKYVRTQRQKAVLLKRFKVPPAVGQFSQAIAKNQAVTLFNLLKKYVPETRQEKKQRLYAQAKEGAAPGAKPVHLKFGLKHVTTLVEEKKAKLVVIAHDVDPIELVCWLPTLCKKMDVPYVIVKGKSRLGKFVHMKQCAALALTEVAKEDEHTLGMLLESFNAQFKDATFRKWTGGELGVKSKHAIAKLEKKTSA